MRIVEYLFIQKNHEVQAAGTEFYRLVGINTDGSDWRDRHSPLHR